MSRLAIAAIRAYRRWGSGRGPLARVRCSFQHAETCSAYGLRIAHGRGLVATARLVRARLRRCRATAVYRVAGAAALGWGAAHDAPPDAIGAELAAAAERDDSAAVVWRARAVVARWRGDLADQAACAARLDAVAAVAPTARPVLRVAPRGARGGVGIAVTAALVVTAAVVVALAGAPRLALIAGAVAAPVLGLRWRGRVRRGALVARLRAQAAACGGAARLVGAARATGG